MTASGPLPRAGPVGDILRRGARVRLHDAMGLATIRNTILKILWGGFLLLSALYCLLAFLPYTYCSLIKAPPYAWIPWFVRHDPALYWLALGAGVGAYWPLHKGKSKLLLFGLQAGVGVYLAAWPVLPSLHSDWTAYLCGLGALALLIPVVALDTVESISARRRSDRTALLDYSTATVVASVVALLWAAGAQWRLYGEAHSVTFGLNALELTAWSVLCHILVAILILSILNLIWLMASKTSRPERGSSDAHRTIPFRDFVVRADPFSGKWAELRWLGGAGVRRFFRCGPNVAGLFAGLAVSPVPCGSPGKAGSAWEKPVSASSCPGIGPVHRGASSHHPGRRLERSHSTYGRFGGLARTRHLRLPNPPPRCELFRGHDSGRAVAGRSWL